MGFKILGALVAIWFVNIYLIIPTIALGLVCNYMRHFYISTSRSVKRIESVGKCGLNRLAEFSMFTKLYLLILFSLLFLRSRTRSRCTRIFLKIESR